MSDASMTPERTAEYDALFSRFVDALRADTGLLVELATVAAKAAAARDELIARGVVPVRVDSMPEVVERPRPKRLSDEARAERDRASKRRSAARKAAAMTDEERAAASAKKGAARAARAAAAQELADAQAAPVKTQRVPLTDAERLERRRESQRRYSAKKAAERPARPTLTDEERVERRREAQRRYNAKRSERKRERAAFPRQWYPEHKRT